MKSQEYSFCQKNQVVQAPGHLHDGDGSDHRHDDQNHIDRYFTRCETEHQREHQHTQATGKANADTASRAPKKMKINTTKSSIIHIILLPLRLLTGQLPVSVHRRVGRRERVVTVTEEFLLLEGDVHVNDLLRDATVAV